MSTIPSQVQRQADEAARIEQEIANELNPQATPPAPAPASPETPLTPSDTTNVQPQPTPAPAPVVDWEQRYRSLEGKYRAEVPRLHETLKELRTTVSALESKVSAPPPAPVPETPKQKAKLVTDEDARTFGPDLLDVIKRQAQEIADDLVSARETTLQTEIQKLAAENEKLRSQIGDVSKSQQATAQDSYLAHLARLIPDWSEVNVNPEFLAWLDEVDPLTGMKRQVYLDNAYQTLDANRTAVLFNAWKATKAPTPPASQTPPQPQTPQSNELARQITPGKSKSTPPPPADPNTRVWSTSDIEKFYADVRRGGVSGEDAARIEKEIDLAVSTGRVR